jgi:PKD repeat protein
MVTRNKIYLNNFLYNTDQGEDKGYDNRWDTGNIGNYWSDYLGVDSGGMTYPWDLTGKHMIAGDGIGDTLCPYPVDADSGDYYPIIRLSGWVPIADAGPDQTVDVGEIVIFSGIGSWDLDGWIVNYTWDFGNGSFSYGMNVTHTYPAEGIYTVTLTVTDNDGFSGTDICNITVIPSNEPPVADANGPYSGSEGSPITFDASGSHDPDGDILQYRWDLDNNGVWDSPWSSSPFTDYTWGDDYSGIVAVEVYDGEFTDTAISNVTVYNVVPSPDIVGPNTIDENSPLNLEGYGTDPGSDDLTFTWEFEYGPTITNIYYNNGMGPDSYPSPEINPMDITVYASHIYGDNGVFAVTLTVEDDDGGVVVTTFNVTVNNVLPIVDPGGPYTIDENLPITLTVNAYDTGSDDLTITWDWGDGFSGIITTTYLNDGIGPDRYPSPDINPISFAESQTHTYGDNAVFNVTLTVVDDDGGTTVATIEVIVNNIAPTIMDIEAYMFVNFSLRVAGEKYHSVGIHLYEDDIEIWSAQVTRQPGSPDAQAATLSGYSLNLGSSYKAVIDYLPNDPRVNGNVWGGNPVWVILEFQDGTTERIHHTFNVRQSYWDTDHWNHIDPWEVDLTDIIYRHNITFQAVASDPGSDDLIFVWDFGDGGITGPNAYFNNGMNPDPYPSPEINPINATDNVVHAYAASGIYTITLTVRDDDGGITTETFVIVLPG